MDTRRRAAVQSVLAATANPEYLNQVDVSQPSAALVARADAQGAFDSLFLGLGAVATLVGAVGVANIMIISVSNVGARSRCAEHSGHEEPHPHPVPLKPSSWPCWAVPSASASVCSPPAVYASTKGWIVVVPHFA